MEEYKDTLYKFITKEENFDLAFEINQEFYDIVSRMLFEFWEAVKKYVEDNLPEDFKVKLYFEDDKMIEVYKKRRDFSIAIFDLDETPRIGIYIEAEDEVKNIELKEKLLDKQLLDDLELIEDEFVDDFIAYHELREDFDSLSVLRKILPSNKDILVKVYGNKMITKIKRLEEFYEQ